jgi:hypothetical protein
MRLRLFFAILFSAIILSCSHKDSVPKGILSKVKMQAVLWDVMRIDAFVKDYILARDTSRKEVKESEELYEKVFKFHKTTRTEFAKSFDYYSTHPQLMKEVLDSITSKGIGAPTRALTPVAADSSKLNLNDSAIRKKIDSLRRIIPATAQ